MSRLPEGAFTTSIDGRECTIYPRVTGPSGNFNVTSRCNTPATFVVMDNHSTTRPTAVQQTRVTSILSRSTPAPVVVAEDVNSSTTPSRPSISSEPSRLNSILPSDQAIPSNVSPPPSPAGPPAPSFITVSSTSTVIPGPTASTSTISLTISSTSTPSAQKPAQNTSSSRISQQVQAPAQQAPLPQPSPQSSVANPGGGQPNSQVNQSPLPASQKTRDNLKDNAALATPAAGAASSGSSTGQPVASTPTPSNSAPTGVIEPSSSDIESEPVAKTTLETSASSLASSDSSGGESPTPTTLNSSGTSATTSPSPQTTTADSSFNDRPSKDNPVSEVPGGPVINKPTVGTADTSSGGTSSPPTGMIVGVAVGSAAVLILVALLLWFWRRRTIKKTREERSSAMGNSGISPSPRRAYISNGAVGWLPSRGSQKRTLSSDLYTNRFTTYGQAGPKTMTERGAGPGYLPGLLAAAPTSTSAYTRQVRHSRSQTNPGPISPGLDLDLEGIGGFDPFSDSNAIPQSSGPLPAVGYPTTSEGQANGKQPAPTRGNNGAPPVVPAVSSRPHVRSLSATARISQRPAFPVAPAPTSRRHSVNRESGQSVDSFTNRRNKFRSDPFDLEIESRLIPSVSGVPDMPRNTIASSTYSRPSSLSSSKYTSGVPSISDWSLLRTSDSVPAPLATPVTRVGTGHDSPTLRPTIKPGDRTRMPTRTDGPAVVFGQAL